MPKNLRESPSIGRLISLSHGISAQGPESFQKFGLPSTADLKALQLSAYRALDIARLPSNTAGQEAARQVHCEDHCFVVMPQPNLGTGPGREGAPKRYATPASDYTL